MIALLLALCVAFGGPAAAGAVESDDTSDSVEMARQAAQVESLAQQVAQTRDGGASRDRVADAMARYRAEAETLARLREAVLAAEEGEDAAARRAAAAALTEALATGTEARDSRAVLAAWLGTLSGQIDLLDRALAAATAEAVPDLRRDLLLDIAERAGLVALVSSHDASRSATDAELAELRAHTLRRSASGMTHDLGALMEARKLEDQSATYRKAATEALVLRDAAVARQQRAFAALENRP